MIQERLFALRDEKYREFHRSLIRHGRYGRGVEEISIRRPAGHRLEHACTALPGCIRIRYGDTAFF